MKCPDGTRFYPGWFALGVLAAVIAFIWVMAS